MGMPNLPQNLCGKGSLHRARKCAPQNKIHKHLYGAHNII
jgi:hypothetical protein